MQDLMRTEIGRVSCKWEDNIAPSGITLKFIKQEPTAQEILETCEKRER